METVSNRSRSLPLLGKGILLLVVGLFFLGWLLNTPPGLLGKADAVGYSVCHRIDLRSFHLGDRQLPLCVRCSGMYLGALLGLVYMAVFSPRRGGMPPKSIWIVYVIFVLAFGFDGINSYLHLFPGAPGLYKPQNWARLVTGTGMGLVLAGVLYPAFNQTTWQNWNPTPAISSLRKLLPIVSLALILDLIVMTEKPFILYPVALLSAGTVVILLTMIYSMVWVMILRKENRFLKPMQLFIPLVAGFGMAILQIAILDLVRFALTGSWDGFHFG